MLPSIQAISIHQCSLLPVHVDIFHSAIHLPGHPSKMPKHFHVAASYHPCFHQSIWPIQAAMFLSPTMFSPFPVYCSLPFNQLNHPHFHVAAFSIHPLIHLSQLPSKLPSSIHISSIRLYAHLSVLTSIKAAISHLCLNLLVAHPSVQTSIKAIISDQCLKHPFAHPSKLPCSHLCLNNPVSNDVVVSL